MATAREQVLQKLKALTYDAEKLIDDAKDQKLLIHEEWYDLITQVANLRVALGNIWYDEYKEG